MGTVWQGFSKVKSSVELALDRVSMTVSQRSLSWLDLKTTVDGHLGMQNLKKMETGLSNPSFQRDSEKENL